MKADHCLQLCPTRGHGKLSDLDVMHGVGQCDQLSRVSTANARNVIVFDPTLAEDPIQMDTDISWETCTRKRER